MTRLDGEFFYNHSERCKRISVDIDSLREDPLKVLKTYFILKQWFPYGNVTVEQTLHGYHVKVIDESIKQLTIPEKLQVRQSLGDCVDRVAHDEASLRLGVPYFSDTLFTVKFHSTGETRFTEEVNPLALPWASKLPAKKI